MTYRHLPEPLPLGVEEARKLPIPDGLTAEQEHEWLVFEQRIHPEVANAVVCERHPDEWPPPGVDFAAVEVCPHCGSDRLHGEERDADAGPDGTPPPRESYGLWVVCDACGREWPGHGASSPSASR